MEPYRQSQVTLPSTQHPSSPEPQIQTDTSLHNSLVSHPPPEVSQSLSRANHSRNNAERLRLAERTNSQRSPERGQEQRKEQKKMCKSQGQRSEEIHIRADKGRVQQRQQEVQNKIQSSWGGENLLYSLPSQYQNAELKSKSEIAQSQKPMGSMDCSQVSENLLDFSDPIDGPWNQQGYPTQYVAIVEERCQSEVKPKGQPMEIQHHPKLLEQTEGPSADEHQGTVARTPPHFQSQKEVEVDYVQQAKDIPMEIEDIELLRKKASNQALVYNGPQQIQERKSVKNRSLYSVQNQSKTNSSDAVQHESRITHSPQQSETSSHKPKIAQQVQNQPDLKPEQHSLTSLPEGSQPNESDGKSDSKNYAIEVCEVHDEVINSHIKNNDIYGIQAKARVQEEEIGQKQHEECLQRDQTGHQRDRRPQGYRNSEERQNRAVLAGYYDASQESSSRCDNRAEDSEVHKVLQSTFHLNQTRPTEYSQQPEHNESMPLHLQPVQSPQTLLKVLKAMQNLLAEPSQRENRLDMFKKLITPHIDLMFMRPIDEIGRAILSNGESAILFCNLYVLNEEFENNRRALEKYLTTIIDEKVERNREKFVEYRQRFYPHKKIGLVQAHSWKIQGSPSHQEVPSLRVSAAVQVNELPNQIPVRANDNSSTKSRGNTSVEVNQPSVRSGAHSTLKSAMKPFSISEPQTEGPVRRVHLNTQDLLPEHDPASYQMSVQPKRTRKAKPARKVRMDTNQLQKSTARRQVSQQKSKINKELKRLGIEYHPAPKAEEKDSVNEQERSVNSNKGFQNKQGPLGSGYTYLEMKSNDSTYLCSVRASHRLKNQSQPRPSLSKRKGKSIGKSPRVHLLQNSPKRRESSRNHHLQQQHSIQEHRKRSQKKRSIRKTNERLDDTEELLNVDYVKNHFRQIHVQPNRKTFDIKNFTPISREDKYITDLLKQYSRLNQQQESLQRDYEESQTALEGSNDQQELEEITMTNRRIQETQNAVAQKKEQIKKKLQQYYTAPIEVERVVDPNINNHGIYALLELTKKSSFIFKARYFVTQISCIEFAPRKHIDEDLQTIRALVEEEERDNIGSMAATEKILSIIRKAESERDRQRSSGNSI